MTTNVKIRAIANTGEARPEYLPIAVVRPMTIALWLLGIPPVSARTRRLSLRSRTEVSVTLAAWQIVQATIGASSYFISRSQFCRERIGPCLQGIQAGVSPVQDASLMM